MEPEKNMCHKCKMFVSVDESLDCFVCGLSCRCLDCIPKTKKVFNDDGTFKYLCPQCIRKRRGPTTFYDFLNQITEVK